MTASGQSPEDSSRGKTSIRPRRPTISKIITQPRAALADIFSPSGTKPETVWASKSTTAYDVRMLFKRRISNIYSVATNLKSYVELNHSGFRKILKKFVIYCSLVPPIVACPRGSHSVRLDTTKSRKVSSKTSICMKGSKPRIHSYKRRNRA